MKSALFFVSFFLLMNNLASQCEKGTLKCNLNTDPPTPEVCDFLDSYVLNIDEKKCEQKIIEGCQLPAFNDASKPCFLCNEGLVFDVHNAKCVAVTTQIENCLRYVASDSSCSACAPNYFLDGGKCTAVQTSVLNCALYSSLTECSVCNAGYYLKEQTCVSFTSQPNCLIHTDRLCQTCTEGSLYTPSYLHQTEPTDTLYQLVVSQALLKNTWAGKINKTVCPNTTVAHCVKFETFNKCSQCSPGYFINKNGICEENPQDPIPNCELYSSLTTCIKCKGVFYLAGENPPCSKATEVLNCKSYKATKDECGECLDSHYLDDANNKCILRNHPKISNCLKLNPYADQCSTCDSETIESLDKTRCYEKIDNCLNLSQAASFNVSKHTCLVCNPTHYLEANACKLRTVPNCIKYKENSDQCEKCEGDNSYLKDNKCEVQNVENCYRYFENSNDCDICNENFHRVNNSCEPNNVTHCTEYVPNSNSCQVCKAGYYNIVTECKLQNVPHCKEYLPNKNRCKTCQTNYYPSIDAQDPGKTCEVQSENNCVQFQDNTNTCTKCALAFYWNGSACVPTDKDHCKKYTDHKNICEECALGWYVPKDGSGNITNDGTCVQQNVTGCIQYTPDTNKCTVCSKGYWLNGDTCTEQKVDECIIYVENTGKCSKCSAGFYLKSESECKKQEITKCVHHIENKNECDTCQAGYWKENSTTCTQLNIQNCIKYDMSNGNCTMCSKGYWLQTTGNNANKLCNQNNIAGCIKYDGAGGCSKCAQKRIKRNNGTVDRCDPLNIDNCVEYDSSTGNCSTCAKGYYKNNSGAQCLAQTNDNCIEFKNDTSKDCKTCALGYYLDTSQTPDSCSQVSKSNCILYTPNTNTCTKCDFKYYLDTSVDAQNNNNKCTLRNVPNCIEYETDSKVCKTCAVGYFLKAVSNADPECSTISTKENCVGYNLSTGECNKCDFGYYLDGGNCLARDKSNCIQYDGDTNDCSLCMVGYYLGGGYCKIQDKTDCIDFTDNQNNCTTCAKGFYKDTTDQNKCKAETEGNCIEFAADGKCTHCKMGFFKESNGTCSAQSIAGCIEYVLNESKCTKCEPDYWKNGDTCTLLNVTGCIEYNYSNGECTTCANNYHLASGTSCLQKNTDKCIEYNGAVCSKCSKKYYLQDSDKTCQPQSVDFCAEYVDNENKCEICGAGYKRESNKTCSKNNQNYCLRYTQNTDTCEYCAAGTYLRTSDKSCQIQDDVTGCVLYEPNLVTCKECQIGMYKNPQIDANECLPQDVNNCIEYKYNENKCEFCEAGYYKQSNGTCAEQSVTNCIEYTPNSNICIFCAAGYFLDYDPTAATDKFKCTATNISNCVIYHPNSNNCKMCDNRYFLDGVACTERPDYDSSPGDNTPAATGCIEYSDASSDATVQTCAKCGQLTKLDSGACVDYKAGALTDHPNCRILTTDATPVCKKCAKGFYTTDNGATCTEITGGLAIANCVEYVEGERKCAKCKDTHMPESNDQETCVQDEIQNCVGYRNGNEKFCTKCASTFYPINANQSCSQITDQAKCHSSNGVDNQCTQCKKGFYLNSNVCTARTAGNIDENCLYITSTSDDKVCTKCEDDYFSVTANAKYSVTDATMSSNNCSVLDSTKTAIECKQCNEWYKLTGTTCSASTHSKLESPCKQKVASNTTELNDKDNCAVCSFDNLYYLSSGTCTSRGILANAPNCHTFDPDGAGCDVCKNGFKLGNLGYLTTCESEPAAPKSNCKVYSNVAASSEACLFCEQGYFENSGSCTELETHKTSGANITKLELLRGYGTKLEPLPSKQMTTAFANCEKFTQIEAGNGETAVGCSKCKDTFVGIVTYDKDNTAELPAGFAEAGNSHSGKTEVVNTFSKCMAGNLSYKGADDNKVTADNTCAIAYQDSDNGEYACLRCKNGFKGKIKAATQKQDNTALSGSIYAIGDCVDASSEMSRAKDFMHYRHLDKWKFLRWNSLLTFDTCSTNNLVYLSYQDSHNGHLIRTEHKNAQSGSPENPFHAHCLPDNRLNSGKINNCQFYILASNLTGNFTDSTNFDVTCAMCEPGYTPDNLNGQITTCSAIDHTNKCDVTDNSKNTWMNACAVPKNTGWEWSSSLVPQQVEYHKPVISANKLDFCLSVINASSSNRKCNVCQQGYQVYDGKCTLAVPLNDFCDAKVGDTDFEVVTTSNNKIQFRNVVILRYLTQVTKYQEAIDSRCYKCTATDKVVKTDLSDTTIKICNDDQSLIADCELHSGQNVAHCHECSAGKTLNTSDNTCAAALTTPDANCKEGDGTNCTRCRDDYALPDAGGTCAESFCKIHVGNDNTNDCLVCKDEHPEHGTPANTKLCNSTKTTNPTCLNYSPHLGHCIKAVGLKTLYVIYTKSHPNIAKTANIEDTVNIFSTKSSISSLYNYDYPFIKIEIEYSNSAAPTYVNSIDFAQVPGYDNKQYTNNASPTADHCFKKIDKSNFGSDCTSSQGGACKTCQNSKRPGVNGQCAAFTTAANNSICKTGFLITPFTSDAETADLCSECTDNSTHYLSSGVCTPRANTGSDNCDGRNKTEDKCTSCASGNFYTSSTGVCAAYTFASKDECAIKNKNADNCLVCKVGHFISSNACSPYSTATFCKEFEKESDGCVSCENGFKKDASNDWCVPMQAQLCKTFDMSAYNVNDFCATCYSTHKLGSVSSNTKNCILKTVAKNCLTHDETLDRCKTCKDGFYLDANFHCQRKTSRLCKTFKSGYTSSENICETCSDAFKTKTVNPIVSCEKKTAAQKCKTFASGDDDKCATCTNSMFFTSGPGTCTEKTPSSCKEFKESTADADKTKCKSCEPGFKLDPSAGATSETCVQNDAVRCLTWHATDNKCGTCSSGMKLDGSSKNCENKSPNLCESWSTTEDKCATCKDKYYFKPSAASDCTLNTGTDCSEIKNDVNGCKTCKSGWVLGNPNCEKNDADLCKSFKTDSKNCADCESNYMLDNSSKHCVIKTALNCLTFSTTENKCATCKNGFVLSENNGNCEKNKAKNCLTWANDKHECVTCSKLRILNNNKSECVLKTVKNCKTMDASLNKCTACEKGFVLNNNTGNCDPTSAKNCLDPSTSEHKCNTCPAYFLKNSLESCDLNEGENCKVIGETEKGCKECAFGFKYDNNTKNCVSVTGKNCLTYATDATYGAKDECATCTDSFKIDGTGCKKKEAKLCETYETGNTDQCKTCKADFRKVGNDCKVYTSNECKTYHSTDDRCDTCGAFFYYDGSKHCVEQTATLCSTFNSSSAGCDQCEADHVKSGNNCSPYTGNNCEEWKTDGTGCLKCSDNFYPNGAHCQQKSGDDCKTWKTDGAGCGECSNDWYLTGTTCNKTEKKFCEGFKNTVNECDKCALGFYMDSGDKECKKNEGKNCLTYKTSANGCNTCNAGFKIDPNNTLNCISIEKNNCKTFVTNSDQCGSCEVLYRNNGGECVKNTATYCSLFDQTANKCINCALGWYKNSANSDACEKVTAQHCKTFQLNIDRCATCLTGYVFNNITSICDANNALNCLTYKDNEHKCEECQPEHYKDSSGVCQKHTVNCLTYKTDANECLTCKENTYLNNDKECVQNTAAKCDLRSKVKNECITCENKYWIDTSDNNICKPHSAQNCLKYNKKKDECSECLTNVLTNVDANGKITCTGYTAQNCDGYHVGSDECLKCASGSYETQNNNKLVCVKRNNTNCATFSLTEDKCTSCINSEFLSGNGCTKSTVVPNCATYKQDSDACQICEAGHYKHSSKNECIRFPDGVANCKEYSSQLQCKFCNETTYLETNTCKPVLKLIDGCVRYYSATDCHSCSNGKLLVNNECKDIVVTNCSEYKDEKSCLVCSENHILFDNGTCQSSGIANCRKALKGTNSNVCSLCSKGYFLSEDKTKCEEPKTPIDQCIDYESQEKCKECANNHIMSADGTKCELIGDLGGPNCLQAKFTSEPVCDECYFGYFRTKQGTCEQIKLKSCYLMDANNEKCLLCATGSYMDNEGVCQGDGITGSSGSGSNGSGSGSDGDDDSRDNRVILRSITVLMLFALLFFRD